jgi:hypothetical protein
MNAWNEMADVYDCIKDTSSKQWQGPVYLVREFSRIPEGQNLAHASMRMFQLLYMHLLNELIGEQSQMKYEVT